MDPYAILAEHLRENELPKLALECRVLHAMSNAESSDPNAHQRIVAVVSNVDAGFEQSAIIVLKRRKADPKRAVVLSAVPIRPGLRWGIKSLKSGSPAPSIEEVLDESKKPWSAPTPAAASGESASPAEAQSEPGEQAFVLSCGDNWTAGVSSDTRGLQDFFKVIEELTAAAASQQESTKPGGTHAWLAHYVPAEQAGGSAPLFSRFSNSSFKPAPPRPASPAAGELRVVLGTFNAAGLLPEIGSEGMEAWLGGPATAEADIIMIAIQECEISQTAYLFHTPEVRQAWEATIEDALGPQCAEFLQVASRQLVGLFLFVYARRSTAVPQMCCLATTSVGVGLGGWVANKGAVAARFRLGATTICVVGSHLPAMEGAVALEQRRWAHLEILRRTRFQIGHEESIEAERRRGKKFREGEGPPLLELSIMDHDLVFWAGDLNFRLDLEIGEVKKLIRKKNYATLLRFDQLLGEIKVGSSFVKFEEQNIDFPPTYKFDIGTDEYDTSEKLRTPAWTDRILWRTSPEAPANLVKPIDYVSIPEVLASDHKPVRATFFITPQKAE